MSRFSEKIEKIIHDKKLARAIERYVKGCLPKEQMKDSEWDSRFKEDEWVNGFNVCLLAVRERLGIGGE